jgi:DNA-binding NarL/FixJ family response regulator
MPGELEALIAAGSVAMQAGRWGEARESFQAAVAVEETPEALYGLGDALWWLGEIEDGVACAERAYAGFRKRPDHAQAAMAAIQLCIGHGANLGNLTAARGWLGRAESLVEQFQLEPLRGWLGMVRAYVSEDPADGERWARASVQFARAASDPDLELCALAQLGASLVAQGRVQEGVPYLDEAMAGSLGGERGRLDTVAWTSCQMIVSCSNCADFGRLAEWVKAADGFIARYGCPFLYAKCRVLYGGLLIDTGSWGQAEVELEAAVRGSRASSRALHGEALAKLAELRLAQGRIEEAAHLLAGFEDHAETALVLATIELVRGEPSVAASILRRRLDEVGGPRVEAAPLLELLCEAQLKLGDPDAAVGHARRLAAIGAGTDCDVVVARGERALGRAMLAMGQRDGARPHLEASLAAFIRLEMPFEIARTRALLATALGGVADEVAIAEARSALAVFERLGAGRDADAAASLLRSFGAKASRAGPKGAAVLTKREHEVLALLAKGMSNPEIADRLYLSRKTVQHHVAHVLSKLGLRNRAEAAAYATRELAPVDPGDRAPK